MDVMYTPEEEAFRAEVRAWMTEHVTADIRDCGESNITMPRAIRVPFYKAMHAKGWACPRWPKQYGGPGFTPPQQVIFFEEMGCAGAPSLDLGVIMASPMIMMFGTKEQKERFLPPMLTGDEIWCQGFSEPGAGSDLAAVAMKAELDGDEFVLNGRKLWSTNGLDADWMFALVRTDPAAKKQNGISFLLVDMKTPGITVTPIHQITDASNFCEFQFDNARVPAKNLLGKLNDGWTIAKALLLHERTGVFSSEFMRRTLDEMINYARTEKDETGRPLLEDSGIRRQLAQAGIECDAVGALGQRASSALMRGKMPGNEASVNKLYTSESFQRMIYLGLKLQGQKAQVWNDDTFGRFDAATPKAAAYSLAMTIAGGTSEIQRNIIAELVLGMPR